MHFCARSNRFKDINRSNFYLKKGGQGHGVQFSQCCSSVAKYQSTEKSPYVFCASSNRFEDIKYQSIQKSPYAFLF